MERFTNQSNNFKVEFTPSNNLTATSFSIFHSTIKHGKRCF